MTACSVVPATTNYGGRPAPTGHLRTCKRDDVILDFTDGEDRIDLTEFGLSGFDDLTLSSDAGGVTIHMTTSGGGTILLEGFDIANLDASDFIF